MKLIRTFILIVTAAACAAFCASARAQTVEQEALEQQGLARGPVSGPWNITLGAGIAAVPDYPGADRHRARLAPLVSIVYDKLIFLGPYGLGVNAIRWNGLRAGPILGFEGGRRESSDIHLTGLGDISSSFTAGAFAAYRPVPGLPVEISGTMRQAVTHTGNGLNGLLRLDYVGHVDPGKVSIIGGPHFEFGNREYEQTWFGVTPAQSEQSGLPVFTPGAGLRAVGLHVSLTYLSTEHVLLRVFGDASKLTGDAADSPIVLRTTQAFVGVGAAYHF